MNFKHPSAYHVFHGRVVFPSLHAASTNNDQSRKVHARDSSTSVNNDPSHDERVSRFLNRLATTQMRFAYLSFLYYSELRLQERFRVEILALH